MKRKSLVLLAISTMMFLWTLGGGVVQAEVDPFPQGKLFYGADMIERIALHGITKGIGQDAIKAFLAMKNKELDSCCPDLPDLIPYHPVYTPMRIYFDDEKDRRDSSGEAFLGRDIEQLRVLLGAIARWEGTDRLAFLILEKALRTGPTLPDLRGSELADAQRWIRIGIPNDANFRQINWRAQSLIRPDFEISFQALFSYNLDEHHVTSFPGPDLGFPTPHVFEILPDQKIDILLPLGAGGAMLALDNRQYEVELPLEDVQQFNLRLSVPFEEIQMAFDDTTWTTIRMTTRANATYLRIWLPQ